MITAGDSKIKEKIKKKTKNIKINLIFLFLRKITFKKHLNGKTIPH